MKALYVKYYSSISDKILHHRKHTLLIQFNVICLVQDISSSAWHHIPCAVLLWPVSWCLILLQHLCLASFPFTGNLLRCVGNIIITWPQQEKKTYKIQQKCEQQDQRNWTIFQLFRRVHSTGAACWDFFCFFIPPASLAGKLLCWQLQPTKKKYIVYKKEKRKKKPS